MHTYFMRNGILFVCILFFISAGLHSQGKLIKSPIEQFHFCPFSPEHSDHYVPRRKTLPYKNTDTKFEVTYFGNIPTEAIRSFEDGTLEILKELINTPIPIRVAVSWEQRDAGNLAAAGPTNYWQVGENNSPLPNRVYPIALYEKIQRRNLNGDDFDINVFVNSGVSWHYDFDSTPATGSTDFVSVMLHEMFHGLGFLSFMFYDEDNGTGFYNVFNNDRHTVMADHITLGQTPLDAIQDGSVEMGDAFKSGNLFFNLINSEQWELYAPSSYDSGSSLGHLDQATYTNSRHSLMTPFLSPGKVERDPGAALDIMYDMGWDMTYIIHEAEIGSEDLVNDKLLEVEIISDSDIKDSTLFMHYSTDGFISETIVPLELNATTGRYESFLPGTGENIDYQYFFEVENSRDVKFTNPGDAPNFVYDFKFALDIGLPFVTHEPISQITDQEPTIQLEAEVTDDFLGIDSVFVEWEINGVVQPKIFMSPKQGFDGSILPDEYITELSFPNGALNVGDALSYRIIALDRSKASNRGKSPLRGEYWTIIVTETQPSIVTYINEFESDEGDFDSEGFNVVRSSGFSTSALNSQHPYPEAGANNFLNLISELQIPIEIREERPLIEFEEIVLVETGENGTRFGDPEFWDYVIVEGRRVGEGEWLPFLDGYDSNARAEWRTAYNTNPMQANASLIKPRIINMTGNGNFVPGDLVNIRFRLYSDPFLNAWGWAVDNLKIQDVTSAVSDFVVQEELSIFPNPFDDELIIQLNLLQKSDELRATVTNMLGQNILSRQLNNRTLNINESIDMSHLESGIYFLNIYFNNRDVFTEKIIKH